MVLTTYSTIETDFRRQQYGFKRQGVLEKEASPLHAVDWFRIVLDEGCSASEHASSHLSRTDTDRRSALTPWFSLVFTRCLSLSLVVSRFLSFSLFISLSAAHSIKDRSSSTARAVFAMKTERKWSLSGTPLQNRVGELYSLIRFMGVEPFSNYFCSQCMCKSVSWRFSDYSHCDDCGHKPMQYVFSGEERQGGSRTAECVRV